MGGWEHLVIPMHYNPKRSKVTSLMEGSPNEGRGTRVAGTLSRIGRERITELAPDSRRYRLPTRARPDGRRGGDV